LGPYLIRSLQARQIGQSIREDGPASHLSKAGTPTMGGTLILLALLLSTFLLADITNLYILVALLVTLGFGAIGFVDDSLKLRAKNSKGLSARAKLGLQIVVAGVGAAVLYADPNFNSVLGVPFLKNVRPDLGIWYIPFAILVVVGASNAVNLTDGLDGLAIVPVMIAAATFALIAYLAGNVVFADYLQIRHIGGSGELAVLCGAMIGAGLGFLWFNAPPASIFMGDTGSLALGGMLGAIAVATKHEIALAIIGGLFVLEAVSVIVQVVSFKLTGKRVFKMAPIHHHFEQLGWTEAQIVIRFWIIALVLALIGLSTLKLR
jgi:phospho-N-acetylmuramoyl-pentapeptide-transferase